MTPQKSAPVPAPSQALFENGIVHPDLWLWDSWTAELDGKVHLYCLALSRRNSEGGAIAPADRNDYPFHIRHFTSADGGDSWQDQGAYLTPHETADGAFERNVWSGCMVARAEQDWLCGFTGIRAGKENQPFLQTICIGQSTSGYRLDSLPQTALSCPVRDYDQIRAAGYYLPAKELLGNKDGEEGGPILAWRDPFIVQESSGKLEVFWSAKVSPFRGAVAHATVTETCDGFQIETLHPPIELPDANSFTQAEVPKLHYHQKSATWFLMISACDRINEEQPADEVTKVLRLYKSSALRGPWTSAFDGGESLVPISEHLFGASILTTGPSAEHLTIIAPYTEYADAKKQLTFSPKVTINLRRAVAEPLASPRRDAY